MPPPPNENSFKRYGIINLRSTGPVNRLGFEYFIGKHLPSQKRVFIKTDPSGGQAALREATLLKILNNEPQSAFFPRLVTYKHHNRLAFVATEFIPGETLDRFLSKRSPLPTWQICSLLNQLVPVLKILQCKKIIHRDIRPQNLMVRLKKGKPYLVLIDFSFAVALKPYSLPELPFLLANQWFLGRLGGRYRAAKDYWDDAVSLHKLTQRLEPDYRTNHPEIWMSIQGAIGQLTFPMVES